MVSQYVIGIVEDDINQTRAIRRTIKSLKPVGIEVDFKNYDFQEIQMNVYSDLVQKILEDIYKGSIHSVIIDYKLIAKKTCLNGVNIIREIKNRFYEFPVIILTQKRNECIETTMIDPDKVYDKKSFFSTSEHSSKYVENIFKNIDRYQETVFQLQSEIAFFKNAKKNNPDSNRLFVEKIVKLEKELSKYKPIGQTEIDNVLDEQKILKIINLINRAKELTEE